MAGTISSSVKSCHAVPLYMPPDPQQNWPFSKPLEFLQRIRYGGAVGKQVALAIAALLVLAVIGVTNWGNIHAVYVIVPAIIVIVLGGLYSVQRTLDNHPELASLEGR